jgi:hypothetical protein
MEFVSFSTVRQFLRILCYSKRKKIIFEREVYENEVYIHTYTCIYMYLKKKMRAVTEIGKHFFKRCNEVTFRTREE